MHVMYVNNTTYQWVDFNISAGSGTAARVEARTTVLLVGGGVYYIATDQTIHESYVANAQWVDFNVTAGSGYSIPG